MRYEYQPVLERGNTLFQGVFALLKATEAEFVPPLHTRCSTTQKDLSKVQFTEDEKEKNLQAYFEAMLAQQFILAVDDNQIVGFLSFRKGEKENYVSTIAVKPDVRCKGIGRGMYETLFSVIGESAVFTTRTWETNHEHCHILERLGFRIQKRIDEGRTDISGNPVSSLYYIKEPQA